MVFLDVAFIPSQTSSSTTFLKYCDRGKGLRTTKCLKSVVEGKQGHALCKIPLIQQSLFVSVKFHGVYITVTKMT